MQRCWTQTAYQTGYVPMTLEGGLPADFCHRTWSSRLRNSWPWTYVKACLGLGPRCWWNFSQQKMTRPWARKRPGRWMAGTWEYGPPGKGKPSEPNHHFQVPAVNLPGCSGLYLGGIPHPRCRVSIICSFLWRAPYKPSRGPGIPPTCTIYSMTVWLYLL